MNKVGHRYKLWGLAKCGGLTLFCQQSLQRARYASWIHRWKLIRI